MDTASSSCDRSLLRNWVCNCYTAGQQRLSDLRYQQGANLVSACTSTRNIRASATSSSPWLQAGLSRRRAAQDCDVGRAMISAVARVALAHGDVKAPMQLVLDLPSCNRRDA
jgi:hypothetical protein